jgi:hypothetical protein
VNDRGRGGSGRTPPVRKRHFAKGVILRIEGSTSFTLVEILRIGAADRKIDVLHAPVVRIAENATMSVRGILFEAGATPHGPIGKGLFRL